MAFDDPKQDTAPESGTCIAAEKSMPQNLKKPELANEISSEQTLTNLNTQMVASHEVASLVASDLVTNDAVTSVVTKQTGCRGAGTHEPVRKLVRTESDGAGHAGAGCEP